MGELQDIFISLKDEVHKLNTNIEKLIERDKIQNEKIKELEEDHKELRKDVSVLAINVYKLLGVISCASMLIPLFLKVWSNE